MTRFVVIAGKKQSGKSTLATMIRYGLVNNDITAKIVNFADPLKKMCNEIFGISFELLYGTDSDKETLTDVQWDGLPFEVREKYSKWESVPRSGPMTVREVLQVIGTDIFRERIYKDVWAAAPFKAQHRADIVIIPDCRFPNEMEYASGRSTLVRIKRNTGLIDKHPSEIALDDVPDQRFDMVYQNAGSLDDLLSFAINIITEVKNGF